MTKYVKSFEDELILNFTQTWGKKNTFNLLFFEPALYIHFGILILILYWEHWDWKIAISYVDLVIAGDVYLSW